MAAKGKPYELFGSYLLFKKLESDRLSESWRAGEIQNDAVTNTVILRRFHGGNREALRAAAEHARSVVAGVTGTTIVKGQKVGFAGGVPYLAHEYNGGRSLRTVIDKARGGSGPAGHPVPIDQALAVVEKLATSIDTISAMRFQGAKLTHGALIPQFIWITEEGEVRAAGQQFGRGIISSLSDPAVAGEFGGYFAPELRGGGEPTKASDVYSLGAILFLLLTGQEPPADAASALGGAKLATGTAIPEDIRPILERTLQPDPAQRYAAAADVRQHLDKLLNGGDYAPTTFNLAFYLHNLLKKEMEAEEHERELEKSVDPKPYLDGSAAIPAAAAVTMPPFERPAPFALTAAVPEKKNRMPLIAAVVAILALGGAAAAYMLQRGGEPAAPSQVAAAATTPAPVTGTMPPAPQPIAVVAPATDTATAVSDPDAKKKAIEDAINKRLQEEMMKLQEQYNRDLQKKRVMEPSPVAVAAQPRTTPLREEASPPSAAQLDAARRQQQNTPAPVEATASRPVTPPAQQTAAQPAPVQPAVPAGIQEGDLVSFSDLDRVPTARSPIRPTYPPMAMKRKIEGSVLVSALISETGRVTEVKILRGDTARAGFDDAALRAVRSASFTPAMKGGKRVKTWAPMPIVFKMQ